MKKQLLHALRGPVSRKLQLLLFLLICIYVFQQVSSQNETIYVAYSAWNLVKSRNVYKALVCLRLRVLKECSAFQCGFFFKLPSFFAPYHGNRWKTYAPSYMHYVHSDKQGQALFGEIVKFLVNSYSGVQLRWNAQYISNKHYIKGVALSQNYIP